MANSQWKVRIVQENMPPKLKDDPDALDISATTPQDACVQYLKARSQFRKNLVLAELPGEFQIQVAQLVSCNHPGDPEALFWFTQTLTLSR